MRWIVFPVAMAAAHHDAMRLRVARFDYGGAALHEAAMVAWLGVVLAAFGADAVRRAVTPPAPER